MSTPINERKLIHPLHKTVWVFEKPLLNKIPTSPIYLGISWATIAIIIGTKTALSWEEKATPKLNPSKRLWINEDSRFKYPAVPLPLRFYKHPFSSITMVELFSAVIFYSSALLIISPYDLGGKCSSLSPILFSEINPSLRI